MIKRFIYSVWLFLFTIFLTGITHSAQTSVGSIFVPHQNPRANTGVSYTFSATSGSGIRYVSYALCNNSFANCNTFFAAPLSNRLDYGTYSVLSTAVAQLLQQISAAAGTYYIGLSVLSEGLDCSSNYCFTSQDSGTTALGFTGVYDGTSVTSLTQHDNGNVTLNQQRQQYLYIANSNLTSDGNVISCSLNSTGAVSSCSSQPAASSLKFAKTLDVAITTVNDTQYLYVAAQGYFSGSLVPSAVTACSIGAGGTFDSCTQDTTTADIGDNPSSITITTVDSTQYAYLTDASHGNIIKRCQLSPTSGALTSCSSTGGTYSNARKVSFFKANSLYAYVADGDSNAVKRCSVASDGGLSSCTSTGDYGSGWSPNDIQFAYASNNTAYAYIANFDGFSGTVVKCNVDMSSGLLSGCANTPSSGAPSWSPLKITFGVANGSQYAYVVDDSTSNSIYKCTVGSTGLFSACTQLNTDVGLYSFYGATIGFTTP